jgi:hypothetical protein
MITAILHTRCGATRAITLERPQPGGVSVALAPALTARWYSDGDVVPAYSSVEIRHFDYWRQESSRTVVHYRERAS